MNTHKNARLIAWARQEIVTRVEAGETQGAIAAALGVSRETVNKWYRRLSQAAEPAQAAPDRSSRPQTSPTRLRRTKRRQIRKAREKRWSNPRIAQHHDIPLSTVTAELRRQGLNTLAALELPRQVVRYERPRPGELVHLDIKKLGKIGRVGHRIHGNRRTRVTGIGWEFLHVAIADHSRLTYAEVLPDELGETTAAFFVRAVAWFASHGITVERLLTDNGSAYRSLTFATTCLELGISQRLTRAYRPQTNGKAERVIGTLLTDWAYARAFGRSYLRTRALDDYLLFYNFQRRHSALYYLPPASRLPAAL
ncbi:MAG: IS481 family transposase [Gemmatimonadaceae bacterium]|nr:IS481 family transposase [Gemmatimonadaceae bacterium]